MGTIYIFEDKINGMPYVGQTGNYEERLKGHLKGKKQYIDRAIRAHGGIENFVILKEDNIPEEFLDLIEIGMIQNCDSISPKGYNIGKGGEGAGKDWFQNHPDKEIIRKKMSKPKSEDHKKHMSESQKGEKGSCFGRTGDKHPMFGKKCPNHSKHMTGEKNPRAKVVFCKETNEIFLCIQAASSKYGVAPQSIVACCKGRYKTAGGYHWQYTGGHDAIV